MIPKIINYCWFGNNPKPKMVKKCIKSWKRKCPDYRIIEWNESNFDISIAPLFVRQAYETKKWAFVTDYVRLWAIYNNGGLYFDTDIKLIKNTDKLLNNSAFFAREVGGRIATGLGFGAEKGSPILKELMSSYENASFLRDDGTLDLTVCGARDTEIFKSHGYDEKSDVLQELDCARIYPTEYFCTDLWHPKTDNTYTKTYYYGSWRDKKEVKKEKSKINKVKVKFYTEKAISFPIKIIKKIIGKD